MPPRSSRRRKKKMQDTLPIFSLEVCAFCGTNDTDEVLYGQFYSSEAISLHHNCMFFASGLSQMGETNTGILGFLLPDIEKELTRGKQLYCCYCRKRGATIGCVEGKCKKSFHLPCGMKNGSLHQFFDSFKSFCKYHMPKQEPLQINEDELHCHICYTALTREELHNCLYSPCCHKNWFHKYCLQQYALSAGVYYIKCPLCNNTTEFIKEMKIHGINIPDKDASWELEENAYQDLLTRPECDATVCTCAKGRNHNSKRKNGWRLLSCSECGSHARHIKCGNLSLDEASWKCEECGAIEEQMSKNKRNSPREKLDRKVKNESKQSSSNTTHVVGASFSDSDSCLEKKLHDLANKITSIYPLLEAFVSSSRPREETYSKMPKRNGKTLKKPCNLRRKPREFPVTSIEKRKEILDKCCGLLKCLNEIYGDDMGKGLNYSNPDMETHTNDIALYLTELQDSFQQCLLHQAKTNEEIDDSEGEIEPFSTNYANLSLKHNNPQLLLLLKLKEFLKFSENYGNISEINNKNHDTEVEESSSRAFCNSKTTINDSDEGLRVQVSAFKPHSKSRGCQNKTNKANNGSPGFVPLSDCETDSDILQKHSCLRNKGIEEDVNSRSENLKQRKSCQPNNTKKGCSTSNFSSKDLNQHKINSNFTGSATQPTIRKTCSRKRNAQVAHDQLNSCKKNKNQDTKVDASSSHALCNSKTTINDPDEGLKALMFAFKPYSNSRGSQNKTNKGTNGTLGVVPYIKSEPLSDCETDSDILQMHSGLRNIGIEKYVNCRSENLKHRKSCQANNTKKGCSTSNFSSKDLNQYKINSNSFGSATQPTTRRTSSRIRNMQVAHDQLNGYKKNKNQDTTVGASSFHALCNSKTTINDSDEGLEAQVFAFKPYNKSRGSQNKTNKGDDGTPGFVPYIKSEPLSDCETDSDILQKHSCLRNTEIEEYVNSRSENLILKKSCQASNTRKGRSTSNFSSGSGSATKSATRKTCSRKRNVQVAHDQFHSCKKNKNQDTKVEASSSHALCNNKTTINDSDEGLKAQEIAFKPYSKSQGSQNKTNKANDGTSGFVPYIKSEPLSDCETDSDILQKHSCLRNKGIEEDVNSRSENLKQRKSCQANNTKKGCSTSNFSSKDLNQHKINSNSSGSATQPTTRRTSSRIRNMQVAHEQLNGYKKNKNQDTTVGASSFHALCNSKTTINDSDEGLEAQVFAFKPYNKSRGSQNKTNIGDDGTPGFVPYIKSEPLSDCETDSDILQKHCSLRNKGIEDVSSRSESLLQKKSCQTNNTRKGCSTSNFFSEDLERRKINLNSSGTGSATQPTIRKTCSTKRNAQVAHDQLNSSKKPKTSALCYPSSISESSAAYLNIFDTVKRRRSRELELCRQRVSSESQVIDVKPNIAIKVEEKPPISLMLRSQNRQNSGKINESQKHIVCVKKQFGEDCNSFRL